MDALKQKILNEGTALSDKVLKVDKFSKSSNRSKTYGRDYEILSFVLR